MAIDRSSGTPLYTQLADLISQEVIASLAPGNLLPSERELAQRYQVTRTTLRHAIDVLEAEQKVDRVIGLGTFVHRPKVDVEVKLTSYSEEMQRRGMVPDAKVLDFQLRPAAGRVAQVLNLEPGQHVVLFRRLLLADGEPMSVDENYIPSYRVPGITEEPAPNSLYNVLAERYQLIMEWGQDTIEAAAASSSLARLLKVETGSPVLRIERHAYVSGHVADYSVSHYRADRYKLWVPLQRPGGRSRYAPHSERRRRNGH